MQHLFHYIVHDMKWQQSETIFSLTIGECFSPKKTPRPHDASNEILEIPGVPSRNRARTTSSFILKLL